MFLKTNRGFTLLEVLIALFIFTIISVILVRALHTVFTTQTATQQSATRIADLQIALLFLSRDIEQIVDRPIQNAMNMSEAAVVGTPTQLAFTRIGLVNPMGQLQRSTLQRIHYFLDHQQLIRGTFPALDQTNKTEMNSRIILNDVLDLRFDYLNAKNNFQNTWPPPDQPNAGLPRGIRVTLTLTNGDKITQTYAIPSGPEIKKEGDK